MLLNNEDDPEMGLLQKENKITNVYMQLFDYRNERANYVAVNDAMNKTDTFDVLFDKMLGPKYTTECLLQKNTST